MKKGQQLSYKGKQIALFPLENLRITQGVDGLCHDGTIFYSHKGTKAIDVNTLRVWDIAYAPFDCKVVKKTTEYGRVFFQSLEPIYCADGVDRVLKLKLLHDEDTTDITLGETFKQGDKIYDEGGQGKYKPNDYPHHIHIEVFDENDKPLHPADVFFVNDTKLIETMGYDWKTWVEPVIVEEPKPIALKVGDKVYIKPNATKYVGGKVISPNYKKGGRYAKKPFTIRFDGDKSVRKANRGHWVISELSSWVKKSEVEKA